MRAALLRHRRSIIPGLASLGLEHMAEPAPQPQRKPRIPRHVEVVAIERPAARWISMTLRGEQMEGFKVEAPTAHVKLFLPTDGQTDVPAMTTGPDGAIWRKRAESEAQHRPRAQRDADRHARLGVVQRHARERLDPLDPVAHRVDVDPQLPRRGRRLE